MSYYTDYSNYTDYHEVDEDRMIISLQGGSWARESLAGIAYRDTNNAPTLASSRVASRCCTIQKKNKHHSPSLEGE